MKIAAGVLLLLLSLLMLLGFSRMESETGTLVLAITFFLAVVLPAAAGALLIRSHYRGGSDLQKRRVDLGRKTLESEVLKFAGQKNGKLTVVEVMREFALDTAEAKTVLDSLHGQSLAEIELTDSGIIVYSFYDISNLPDKESSRGVLDV